MIVFNRVAEVVEALYKLNVVFEVATRKYQYDPLIYMFTGEYAYVVTPIEPEDALYIVDLEPQEDRLKTSIVTFPVVLFGIDMQAIQLFKLSNIQ